MLASVTILWILIIVLNVVAVHFYSRYIYSVRCFSMVNKVSLFIRLPLAYLYLVNIYTLVINDAIY